MKTILILAIGLTCVWIAGGQNDGRFRSTLPYTTRRRPSVFDGRYRATQRPVVEGRYRANSSGRYRGANDGRYVPKNDGRYVHKDVPGGGYSGGGGEYSGGGGKYSGGGQYTGGGGQYSGGGGQYSGGGGQYTGDGGQYTGGGGQYTGGGGQYSGGSGQSASGSGQKTAAGGQNSVSSNAGTAGGRYSTQGSAIPRGPAVDLLASVVQKPSTQGKGTGEGGGGWRIIRDENEVDADGYHYLYETENGILAEEQGRIESLTASEEGLRSKGFFEYTGDDGLLYRVNYVADDNGFIPEGEHIPRAPPHVGRLLAYLAANAPNNRR